MCMAPTEISSPEASPATGIWDLREEGWIGALWECQGAAAGRCDVLARREDRRAERLGAELRGFRNGDRQTIAVGRDIRGDDQLTIGMALDLEHAVTQGDDGRTLAEVPAGDDHGAPVGASTVARRTVSMPQGRRLPMRSDQKSPREPKESVCKWIGPDLVGDNEALIGNGGGMEDFEGTGSKFDVRSYWCAHDVK
jgi:hypothetical protein